MSKRIVVAEDFNVSRKVIVSILSKLGHTVLEASNGLEATSFFNGGAIDLLITDYNMPEMNGAELIKQVRASEKYAYIPILLLTTEVNEQKIKMALDENITAWIKKPFQADEFLKIVSKALR
ncbi:response regulator [Cesiribacter sp. SM1]|uniref:response regulator n=1 Tax=Cesiribacter sp. SM1 TaxID=2861196 RepID=UPI001CD2E33A|nr:response regulator [Cesiribacter sp. SM1]